VPIQPLMTGFGLAVAAAMALLAWRFRRLVRPGSQRHAQGATQVADGRSNKGL
jgi:hypothetical protein